MQAECHATDRRLSQKRNGFIHLTSKSWIYNIIAMLF